SCGAARLAASCVQPWGRQEQCADQADVRSSGSFLLTCEDLGNVHGTCAASAAMQAAVDVHQAAVVAGRDNLGVGTEDSFELLVEHGTGDISVLDGEGAAEATALLEAGQRNEIDITDGAKQRCRTIAEFEDSQTVATRVIGDAMREDCIEVREAEALCDKF